MSYTKDNYLRRRTRDSSWQWLMIGALLGLGFASILCVGGYAVGAITFPALEDATHTPQVEIAANETEIAFEAMAAQQTLDAAQQAIETPPAATENAAPSEGEETPVPPTPLPTQLPAAPTADTGIQSAAVETLPGPQPTSQPEAALMQDTPVVGTPPGGEETQVLGLPQAPGIPPELDAIKTEMIPVTGGTFIMGTTPDEAAQARDDCATYGKTCDEYLSWVTDSFPTHQTTVDSFQMEVYEVTLTQYVAFLNWMGPLSHKTNCLGQPCAQTNQEEELSNINFDGTTYTVRNAEFVSDHPVTFVTWWGAEAYCAALNRRLPTEAEWERAARGSQNNVYPWGTTFDPARAMSSISTDPYTVPVREYPTGASPYSVLNMAGNVSEWVYDWYQADYYTQQANSSTPNPTGPLSGSEKVHRGGSWDTIPFFLRSVHRLSQPPDAPTASIGFRCVADTSPTTAPLAPPASSSESGSDAAPAGAPTMAPPPTERPLPTNTPSGPTPTLDPGG